MTQTSNTQGVFLANPSNRDFVTGESQRIGSSLAMILIALILFLVAAGLLANAGQQIWNHQQLQTAGRIVSAEILLVFRTVDTGYSLTVQYTLSGHRYTLDQGVSYSFYSHLSSLDRVNVRYLPTNPAIAEIDTQGINLIDRGGYLTVMLVTALILLFSTGMVLYYDRRNWRLSRNGQFIPGRLIMVNSRYFKGLYFLQITYTFTSPTGTALSRDQIVLRNDIRGLVPVYGVPVLVRYINERTFRLM